MKIYISQVTLINPHSKTVDTDVLIENGSIQEITNHRLKPAKDDLQVDGRGMYLCPGFIDVHFHGALGKDTMDGDLHTLQILSNYCATHGVTSFYPTTWAATPEDIMLAINNVKTNGEGLPGAQVLGVHVEGPYVDVENRGAQMRSMIRTPVEDEYKHWFDSGVVKIITCAPEIKDAKEFILGAVERGIRISIGHSAATYEQVVQAANWGATQATHLFNGMVGLHHRKPGTVGGVLADDRILPQLICDGIHLHPAVVKIAVNAKTTDRMILITDSIRGAGLADGDYDNHGQKFSVRDGIARTPEGGLSGSTLTLDGALVKVMKYTGKSLEEVIPMVTNIPANEMGISGQKGLIKTGFDADVVLLDREFKVEKTIVNGKLVFDRQSSMVRNHG